MQTFRVSYTVTSSDVSNGFARVPVSIPSPYSDTAYTVAMTLERDSDSRDEANVSAPWIVTQDSSPFTPLSAPVTGSGFTAQFDALGLRAGAAVQIHVTTTHD